MTVGVLGGGQLGRMLALAAAELGLSCHVYCPDPKSPAFAVSVARTVAPYEDEAALAAFAGAVDVATFEFENIPVPPSSSSPGAFRSIPARAASRSRRTASPRRS
jgi:5-(carboxyamino)imidazole ribonucleotide synthase